MAHVPHRDTLMKWWHMGYEEHVKFGTNPPHVTLGLVTDTV